MTLLLHPIASMLIAAVALTRSPFGLWRLRQSVRVVRKHDQMQRLKVAGSCVVDEGPVHAVLNVVFSSTGNSASRFFVRHLLRTLARGTDTFVYLDRPVEACLRNARERKQKGSWFNSEMSEEIARQFVEDRSYAEMLEELEHAAPGKVRRFGTTDEAMRFILSSGVTKVRAELSAAGIE